MTERGEAKPERSTVRTKLVSDASAETLSCQALLNSLAMSLLSSGSSLL